MTNRKQSFGGWVVSLAGTLLFLVIATVSAPGGATEVLLRKPSVALLASKSLLTYPCPSAFHSMSRTCPTDFDLQVSLTAKETGFQKDAAFTYTVSGGRILGEGANVNWDLRDAGPGNYSVVLEVHDTRKHRAAAIVNVTVGICPDCVDEWPCPTISVLCYDEVKVGTPISCRLVLGASSPPRPTNFEWLTRDSNGQDLTERISGGGTSISIRSDGLGGRQVTTMVKVVGLDPSCGSTTSASTKVKP